MPATLAGASPRMLDTSFHAALRLMTTLAPDADAAAAGGPSLEVYATPEAPRLISALLLERGPMRAHRVAGGAVVGFAAFLDGTQASRVIHSTPDGVPIVHGTAAAVIRDRRNERMHTWRHVVAKRLYAPRARVPDAWWSAFAAAGFECRDSGAGAADASVPAHPFTVRDEAIHLLQKDREAAEQELAVEWCRRETRALLIDGGISGAEQVARAACAIGVVKSHRTLYAEADALGCVFGLARGERSSVFRVTSPKRATVASWYLRLRDRRAVDPMWGLVRVEVAQPERVDADAIGARADEVSRWILAEASPLALPDARWDTMVYGVRDCEEFLRAVM